MLYITNKEFFSRAGQSAVADLTDGRDGEIDLELIESINADAVAEVDSNLRGIYRLPLPTPAPSLIRSITSDLMIYHLNKRRNPKNISDSLIHLYKSALSKLKELRDRTIEIEAPGYDGEGATSGGTVMIKDNT